MKIRNGFVSNSSSSSFIVAVKESNKCPTCGRSDKSFLDRMPKEGEYEETHIRAMGSETIAKQYVDNWGINMGNSEEIDKVASLMGEMVAFEKMGYVVAFIEISYHDENTNDEFNTLRDNKNNSIVVIKDFN